MSDSCFGVVVGYTIDNRIKNSDIEEMLGNGIQSLRERLERQNLKEYECMFSNRWMFF